MAKVKLSDSSGSVQRQRPALTPDAREKQMISLAVDLAEEKLMDGTASNQIIVHYLRLGSMREQLERERIEQENELLRAKVEALKSAERTEELYANAIAAMQRYNGRGDSDDY